MVILAKRHVYHKQVVLALCDKKCFGRLFVEGELQIDTRGEFYNGKEVPSPGLEKLLQEAQMVNMVGEESVTWGMNRQLIDKKSVMTVGGIPHAQCIKL